MRVQQVVENDWTLVQDVRLRALREDPDVFGASLTREERFTESHWRMRIRTSATWVAVDDGGVGRGIVTMMQEPGSPVDDRHIVALWVAPEARRHGVGWSLIDAVRQASVAQDARTVSLWLLDGNHGAGDLFVRSGFTRTGERQVVPRDPSQTEERYVLTLRDARTA